MLITLPALLLALATSIAATPITPLQGSDNACYYRRSLDAYVRRDASNAEVLCGVKQSTHNDKRSSDKPPADNACYYKRDEHSGKIVGYKRDTNGAEIVCGVQSV